MKVIVTGASTELGSGIMDELNKRGHEVIGANKEDMDITNIAKVFLFILTHKPDVVIHCAEWSDLDSAEEESNRDAVLTFNGTATKYIADAVKSYGGTMMYMSTGMVYSGRGCTPISLNHPDFDPPNTYGESKLIGERAVQEAFGEDCYIIRTVWKIGVQGDNFVKQVLRDGKNQKSIKAVSDRIGSPTFVFDIPRLVVDILESGMYGAYHIANEGGYVSLCELAQEVFRQAHYDCEVIPITTFEEGEHEAVRPYNCRVNTNRLRVRKLQEMPRWQDSLAKYLTMIDY